MSPVGRLIVLRESPKHEIIAAIGLIVWPGLIAPVIGPPLGGFITTYASWRWIFLLNLPLGIIGAWLILHYIPSHAGSRDARFDATGFVLTATALASVIHGLSLIAASGNGSLAGGAFVAVGAAAGYAAVRDRGRRPRCRRHCSDRPPHTWTSATGSGSGTPRPASWPNTSENCT